MTTRFARDKSKFQITSLLNLRPPPSNMLPKKHFDDFEGGLNLFFPTQRVYNKTKKTNKQAMRMNNKAFFFLLLLQQNKRKKTALFFFF